MLIIGKTGTGKSTVASMLTNRDVHPGDNNGIVVSDRAKGVTFECANFVSGTYSITDTVGFGDGNEGSIATAGAIRALKQFLQYAKRGYHMILFVVHAGRITKTDADILSMFRDVLFADMANKFHIIVTGYVTLNHLFYNTNTLILGVRTTRIGLKRIVTLWKPRTNSLMG